MIERLECRAFTNRYTFMAEDCYKITFVGAGRMASAMIKSLLRSGLYQAQEIACCSAKDGTAEKLVAETGIRMIDPEAEQVFNTDTMVLACKPQQLNTVSATLVNSASGCLLISILAGTRIATLLGKFSDARNVVRVMPNTPGSIGEGVSAFSPSQPLLDADRATVENVLRSMGQTLAVEESQLDAITAVSGSGPAYLFLFVEGLYHAALKEGFDETTAMQLAKQTVIGSAKLLEQSGESPETLRIQVTSPNGTTQAAIESFQKNHFIEIIAEAVEAARKRSIELGKS